MTAPPQLSQWNENRRAICASGASSHKADHERAKVGRMAGVDSESADKPGSVWRSHSSGMYVAVHLLRPTRGLCGPHVVLLFGLAPDGVYRAANRCRTRGALLPHPFTLTWLANEPSAVYSLLHFP